jgi:glycosyltransferase involved in cell wall biosynthesis
MRPLRVLHVTPYWADAWAYGGIPRVVGALASGLAQAGHAVTVCATDVCARDSRLPPPPGRVDLAQPWPPQATPDGVELRIFPNRSNRLAHDWQWFTPVGLDDYLRTNAGSFDVAHLHACRNLPGVIAARHLRAAGVPYVITPNGTAPRLERRIAAKWFFDQLGGARVLREAAGVLAVSAAERLQLQACGVPESRIHGVPNPLDLTEFDAAVPRGRFRARLSAGDAPLVVFLGKITPRKRVDVLVRAFQAFRGRWPAARLIIAGNDMGGLARLRALVRALDLRDAVAFTGLLSGRERLEALGDADVVVYPSQDEVFGLVALEALMMGTPVVVSNDSGCGAVVAASGGGLSVTPGDPPALASAIATVLDAPSEWRRAATAAAAHLRDAYGSGRIASLLEGVYRQVLHASAASEAPGVSVVMPVRNGMATLSRTLAAIQAQADGRPFEVIVVDDRSTDGSASWLADQARAGAIRLIAGAGRGASAALNAGIREARHPVICQVDQDVELRQGWMSRLVSRLMSDDRLAAVQGHYAHDRTAPFLARVMALDLEMRYAALRDGQTTHVCTGNTAYRASALHAVGLFDESLGYGNDNDVSYRLRAAGWRLAHCAGARSVHHWRAGLSGFVRQQYGFGYGRLDVVCRHPDRMAGDSVSPTMMMLHPVLLAVAGLCGAAWALGAAAGVDLRPAAWLGGCLAAALVAERTLVGVRAARGFRDPAGLAFPAVHLLRDLAWVAAMGRWMARRLMKRPADPSHSMQPRPASPSSADEAGAGRAFVPRPLRILGVVPAHNEAATIARVIADIRASRPDLDVLVVDDGSTDEMGELLPRLGVQWLQLPERMGVGRAMRAALRYARRQGYDSVVRLDGDGQHCAGDLARVLAPLYDGGADVVLGSRFLDGVSSRPAGVRAAQRALGSCLSMLTGRAVTDPTSGFCALGPRAVRLLAEHHPTGYPEPELRLFLSRNDLHVVEVPVAARARLGGRTSLTPGRLAAAIARVLLAMLIVPMRAVVGPDRD